MTDSYAPAKAAYRELRVTIGPWAHESSLRSLLPCCRKRSNGSCRDTSPSQWTIRPLTCGPGGSPLWRNQATVDEYARAVAPPTAAHGKER